MSVGSIYLYEIIGMKLQNLFIWFYFMTPGLDYKNDNNNKIPVVGFLHLSLFTKNVCDQYLA